MLTLKQVPVLQVVGYKNSGKTTLITKLIEHFVQHYGLNIMTFKHDCHAFQMDQEGKDTWKHKEAGAQATLIQSPHSLGLTLNQRQEKPLSKLITIFQQLDDYDLFLVEGYKEESYPKIVLIRDREDLELLRRLTNIQLIVFWREIDQELYRQISRFSKQGSIPSYLLTEEEAIINYCEQEYINQELLQLICEQ